MVLDGVVLEKCPFCGSYSQYRAYHRSEIEIDGKPAWSRCTITCVCGVEIARTDIGEAVKAWNTRSGDNA